MKHRWIDESRLVTKDGKVTVRREGHGSSSPRSTSPQQAMDASHPKFDSKTEAKYFSYLAALKHGGEIVDFWHHPFSLSLPGGLRHKPDFLVCVSPTSRLQVREVKGWSKNMRDGITRFRMASGLYHCFDWVMVREIKGRWEESPR